MAEAAVTECCVPAVKCVLKELWQLLGYVFCYKRNIGDLNKKAEQLHRERESIKGKEKRGRDALEIIDDDVEPWLGDVDNIIEEKKMTFSEANVAAKATCYNGRLPNLKGRFSLGRKAKKMTEKVETLLTSAPKTISHPAQHPEVEFQPTEDSTQLGTNFHEGDSSSGTSNLEQPPTEDATQIGSNFHEGASSSGTSNHEQPSASERKNIYFDSRRSTIEDVMEALRGNQTNLIVICGLGGIGKTTLMGQVHDRAKKEGLFDEYTMATFKESLDVIQIQGELAEYLGKKLLEHENQIGPRASTLRERLSQGSKKILVMLDNVWTTTPHLLWDIGIHPSCQLLVTSRQQDVFKDMDRRKIFPIDGLPDTDAWSLFEKTAGSCIKTDRELHGVAEKILKKCGGLPIAISTVGTALRGQSIAIWKNAQGELEKANPENVDGVIEHVYGPIKFSYESLPGEEAKSCFLLCCIFEGSADIRIEDLVRYGLGLGIFKGIDSMVDGRNRVEAVVQKLKSRFLLLDTDDPELVRMHDVVRDVAVYIASQEYANRIVVRDTAATVQLMDWPQHSVSEASTYCSSLGVSGLCQLLLLRITESLELPPTIFNRMEDLKVLAISGEYWSRVSLESLVPSLAVLRNLQTLRLENCDFNCDISVIGELRTLMILSLRGSNIKRLPETFKDLSDLKLLDLTDCKYLREIARGVISSLTRLEELYMWNSKWISQMEQESDSELETWMSLKTLAAEQPVMVGESFWKAYAQNWETGLFRELLSLSRLTTLQVQLQPVNIPLTTAGFSKLKRFKISIGRTWTMSDSELEKQSGNHLRVYDLDVSVAAMGSWLTSLLENASLVELKLTQPQLVNVMERVCSANTKRLIFEDCDDVEHLFNTTTTHPRSSSSSAIFPVLHTLKISYASRLKEIFHCELPTGSLKQLRELILYKLPECTYIWKKTNSRSEWGVWRDMIGHFQVLDVRDCSSLKGVIVKDRAVYDDDEEVINFQCLTELTLRDLPSFTGIISKGPEILPEDISPEQSDVPMQPLFDNKVHFPVLTKLNVGHMNFKEIWNNQLSAESFCELKSLEVTELNKLLHFVPTHMQNRLQKLERIVVWRCSSLEKIFESRRLIVSDEGDATALIISESGDQGTQMNKMVSFKQTRQAFQNLTYMSISNCDSLRTLLSPSVARGLVKLQNLFVRDCEKIEEIVAAAAAEGEETEDANMFPQLHTLSLANLRNLGSFSQGKYNLKWPVVKRIEIFVCPNMKKFCSGSLITSKEVKIIVEDAGESVSQELNDSRQEI